MKKDNKIYKLRIYNSNVEFLDVVDAFKSIGFASLQAEQCALITHSNGKYDVLEGDIYELDSIRASFKNIFNITSEVLPSSNKNKHLNNKVMENEKQSSLLFNDMKSLWTDFETSHTEFATKGTKKAAARARKSIQSLKTIILNYKKASVEECKA
jgi:thioester reductase-like protein